MSGAHGLSVNGLTVVKLGGSYAFSPRLPAIVEMLSAATAPVVVVPGGGPFADTVRDAQTRMRFDDRAAHRMALLAMAQFAEALASLAPGLRAAAGFAEIRASLAEGAVPVWSPWPIADGVETLPESWDLTSDSLAAWLSDKLGAGRLLLIKHRDPPNRPISLHESAQAGIVDTLFHQYAKGSTERPAPSVWWLGPAQLDSLAEVIEGAASASPLSRAHEHSLTA